MKVFNVVLVTDVRPLICGSVVVVFFANMQCHIRECNNLYQK